MRLARQLTLVLVVAITAISCTGAIPEVASDEAMILLKSRAGHRLSAQRLNGKPVKDARFFAVQPGANRLSVRVSYERSAGLSGTQHRHCLAKISYDRFMSGEVYAVYAIAKGYTVRLWLQNENGQRLVESNSIRCGAQY